ncbi:Aste57867_812 [Aphanomyces stellatus]|uniref:Terpene synthase n=1 Tax=Aphanomyces stellatus TaxID=120398 RepID=A0A485K8K8_9STRA|nr:hypothetical protein As57867_000811 [Aphanomyces stellatus]VFT78036.1 Aste57867_812 [Aphanomyces stellatus]
MCALVTQPNEKSIATFDIANSHSSYVYEFAMLSNEGEVGHSFNCISLVKLAMSPIKMVLPQESMMEVVQVVPALYAPEVITFTYPSYWATPEPYLESDALSLESNMREWLAPVLTTPALNKRFLGANIAGHGGHARVIGGRSGNYDGAVLITKFVALFTMWDDFIETTADPAPHVALIKRVADGFRDPQAQGFLALWQDYVDFASSLHQGSSYDRFHRALYDWLDSILDEVTMTHDDMNNLDKLWHVRKTSMSTYLLLAHLEVVSRVSLPDSLLQSDEMQQIFEYLAVDHRLFNELVSLPKDILGQEAGNILYVTMQIKKWDLQTALNDALKQHQACVAGVDGLQKKLEEKTIGTLKDDLGRFLNFSRHLFLGAQEWHANAKRYSKVQIVDHKNQTVYKFRVQQG